VADEILDRGVPDLRLAQRREHGGDMLEERRVRPDHEHARAAEPLPVGVEQPGRAVQADGGLARAGGALDADGDGDVRADDLVLLRLDGGDDVAHRADAGALDLAGEDRRVAAVREQNPGVGVMGAGGGDGRRVEDLVLVGRDAAVLDAEPPAPGDTERLAASGAVEGARDVRAPVDDDGVTGLVGDVAAADVPAFAVGVVGAAEEEGRRRVVDQGGRPAVERCRQVLGGDSVAALDGQGERAFPHGGEVAACREQVGLLGGEHVLGCRRRRMFLGSRG
jgi:hypothetical protein